MLFVLVLLVVLILVASDEDGVEDEEGLLTMADAGQARCRESGGLVERDEERLRMDFGVLCFGMYFEFGKVWMVWGWA